MPSFEKIILSKNQCHLKENPIIENPLNRKVVDKVEVKGDPDLLKELQTDKIYLEKLIQNPGIIFLLLTHRELSLKFLLLIICSTRYYKCE